MNLKIAFEQNLSSKRFLSKDQNFENSQNILLLTLGHELNQI